MEKAQGYLEKAASLLCTAVYRMCRTVLAKGSGDRVCDPKLLKEIGAAIKEASGVVAGLEKKSCAEPEGIKIVFGMDGEEV